MFQALKIIMHTLCTSYKRNKQVLKWGEMCNIMRYEILWGQPRKTTAKPIQCDMSRVTLPISEVLNFEIKKSVQKVSLNSFEKPEIFEKNRLLFIC